MLNLRKTIIPLIGLALGIAPCFYSCQAGFEEEEEKTPADPDDDKDNTDSIIPAANFVEIIFGETITINNPFEAEGVSIVNNNGHVVVTSVLDSVHYNVSGSSASGSLKFYSDSLIFINFGGLNLKSDKGSAINVQSKARTFILLKDSTDNKLTDAVGYNISTTEDEKGAVFTEGPLIISGGGALSINALYKHAMCSDEYIRVQRGEITVEAAPSDALHSKSVIIEKAILNLKAESNGIEAEAGYISILGGSIISDTRNDGIKASYIGTNAGINPYISISGGVLDIKTSTGESAKGIQAETDIIITDGDITVNTSTLNSEGIDAGRAIVIDGGTITVNAYEDCINGKESITVNGGKIYCNSTANDGFGSKTGTIKITGGDVFSIAKNSAKKGFDFAKTSTFSITGGTVTGIGGAVNTPTSTLTTQNVLICNVGAIDKGEKVDIITPEGDVLISFASPYDYGALKMLYTSGDFVTKSGYKINKGNNTIKNFTVSSIITTLN